MAARHDNDREELKRQGGSDADLLELPIEDSLESEDGSEDSGVSSFLDRFLRPAPPRAG